MGLVGPSFLFGAPPLAAVRQRANVAYVFCQQVGKVPARKLGSTSAPQLTRNISKMSGKGALKGQKLLAQGNALGLRFMGYIRAEGAKALIDSRFVLVLLPLQGELSRLGGEPKALPWARCFCPFRAHFIAPTSCIRAF